MRSRHTVPLTRIMSLLPVSEAHDPRSLLAEHVRSTAATPGGRVLVRGEPGLGKTTLLAEALGEADDDGIRLLLTRASDWSAKLPHSGLIDLLEGVSPQELDVLAPAQRDAIEVAVSRRIPTHIVLPLTLRVAVTSVIVNLLKKGPVAIVVDDWGLLDDETAEILTWVFTRQGPGAAAALVATERAGGGFFRFTSSGEARHLFRPQDICELPALEPWECEALLRENFGDRLTRTELLSVVRLARGNPLWALEIAHSRTTPDETSGHPRDLPGSVAHLLMSRVSALSPAVADVLATVSALGDAPLERVLQTMAGSPDALDDALESGVIVQGNGRIHLAHPLLSKASMASLGRDQHRNVHARAAAGATSLAERASHLDKAAALGPNCSVADALAEAAGEARLSGASATAAALAERAFERTPLTDASLPDRRVLVAETAFARSDFRRTVGVLGELDWTHLPPDVLDRVLPLHVDALAMARGESAVAAFLAQLRSEFGSRQPQAALVQAYGADLTSHSLSQRRHDAEGALTTLDSRSDLPTTIHRALGTVVLAKLDTGEGLDSDLLDRSDQLERRIRPLALSDTSLAKRGFHSFEVDDFETSQWALEELIKRADTSGQDAQARFFGVHLATALIGTGQVARARDLLTRFDSADAWTDTSWWVVLRARGLLAIAEGDKRELQRLLQFPVDRATPTEVESLKLGLEGLFAARMEQWSQAVPLLQSSVDISEEAGVIEPGRRLWSDCELGEALVALGRVDEASGIADRLDKIAAARPHPLTRARSLRLRGLVVAGTNDLAGAELLFRTALDLIGTQGNNVERARLLLQMGRILRRRRARARARDHFQRALLLAETAQDQLLTMRIRRELDRLGESARAGQLTASESRVAEAVLAGASNADVAAAQFVSIRTVEAHLSAIYRKWGIRSRIQLVAELHRRGKMMKLD